MLFYQGTLTKIYQGDCLTGMKDIPDSSMDLCVTDPPYNISKNYGPESNDHLPPDEYWKWFTQVFSEVYRVMADGYFYCSHSDKGVYIAKPILETIGFEYIQTLIWYGRNGYSMQLHRKSWSYRHEPILFMCKGKPRDLEVGISGMWYTSVIEVPRPQSNFKEGRCHPTQKPFRLYNIIIKRTPGDIVFDPFMGSGTSLLAARSNNRKYIGFDVNPDYCEIAVKRLKRGTAKKENQEAMDLSEVK